jgi:hypothetical protein
MVLRDNWYSHRWYDAVGHGVTKYIQEFATLDSDEDTGDATEFQLTITEDGGGGDSTHVITDLAGGALLITTDNQAVDGINMQLGAVAGECIDLSADQLLYFGTEFAINDVDQTDIFAGVGVTETDWSGGLTDGMYFRSEDESATLYFVTEKNSVELATEVATLADNTYIKVEYLFDGQNVRAYVNDDLKATVAKSAATFPNDELMRLTVEFLTGEATANTCTMKRLSFIHISE